MKIDKNQSDRGAFRRKYRLAGVILSGSILGAGICATVQAAAPAGYENDTSGKVPSSGCAGSYKDGIYLPISQVKHNYVLLLIFDSPDDGVKAGEDLFQADDPTSTNGMPTLSCMPDPDAIDASNRSKLAAARTREAGMPAWGMIVLGGCPSDCTGPGLESTWTGQETKKGRRTLTIDRKISTDPDPLMDLKKGTNWGIMFAGTDDAPVPSGGDTPSPPGVMVWQIRAKDALHAGRILKYLCDGQGLTGKKGYMGHMMIGYKPASET